MIKIEIKHWITGSILFEYSKENNTILETVKEAVKQKAYLRGAYLRGADLRGADLRGAYLQGVDLQGVDLRGVDLQGVDLRGADLREADLREADLREADLRGAYLRGADLQGAYLQGAYLQGAYLRGAYLRGVDLQGVDLRGKKIKKANVFTGLYEYIVIPYITDKDEKRIKMGCFDRLLSEWESDFWNNDKEFPNNGSEKSNFRVMAFETAKRWFEIVGND
ncbi:MAG TPA: pentapeptide repeat-containing protein [Candidatus Wunengus sp. YC60]|uniref:pentapeptide repeat-containing protein n=1 Tax=Candidatus Wunengus sp. YC60 TaxID=3367697 RepID=UPI0040269A62